MRRLYFDHNATCPLRASARRALWDCLTGPPLGNPSSAHADGRLARSLLEAARQRLAAAIDCHRDEIVFTSGGTESNALALATAAEGVIAHSPLEHPSILAPLRKRGRAHSLPVDSAGRVSREAPRLQGSRQPALVTVGLANHETGVVQDVPALAETARSLKARLHTDASQAFGKCPLSFRQLSVDLMTISAHKLGGPVGIGALIIRRGTSVPALLLGGPQEAGFRAGTEAVALAQSFAAAAEEAVTMLPEALSRWASWTLRLQELLLRAVPNLVVHTPPTDSLANTLCVSLPGCPGAALVQRFDLEGVSVSHGSACATGSLEPSPVLLALGVDEALARCSLRLSVGPANSADDVEEFGLRLRSVLRDVRPRLLV
ncbi:MAG: cysteine desulfurase family protein [Planctomycetota bacterium]